MPVLSSSEDIKSLIERHAGIQIVGKPSRVRGDLEFHSNCPWCGGTDRFITRPETGWYTCSIRSSGCGRKGDMLDFLKDYCSMTTREAIEEIGLDPSELDFVLDEREQEQTLARESPPSKKWQEQGKVWLHTLRTKQVLFQSFYEYALKHLRARGLTDETIKRFDLQYMPFVDGWFQKEDAELWGLDSNNFKEGKIRVPEGILIPWCKDGQLWKLEVRRLLKIKDDIRYMEIEGGQEHTLYNIDAIQSDKPVVLCESALCAIAGTQEVGDLAAFVATGGAGKGQELQLIAKLKQASYVLIAMDNDEAGNRSAGEWRALLPKSVRLRPLKKDIGDMLKAGDDIKGWVADGMEFYEVTWAARTIPVFDPLTQLTRAYLTQLLSGTFPPGEGRPLDFGRWSRIVLDIEHFFFDTEKQCKHVQMVDGKPEPAWKGDAFYQALSTYVRNCPQFFELGLKLPPFEPAK